MRILLSTVFLVSYLQNNNELFPFESQVNRSDDWADTDVEYLWI